jgi:hypothetical protein
MTKPDFYAVHSATGMHIGLWKEKHIAEKVIREDYPDGMLTPLYKPETLREMVIETIESIPGAGIFKEEGKSDDWRFRAKLARKEAFDSALAHIVLAFDKTI